MKCPNCEVELPENSKFCAACGVKIENGETHSEGATTITTEETSKAVKTSVKEKVPEDFVTVVEKVYEKSEEMLESNLQSNDKLIQINEDDNLEL